MLLLSQRNARISSHGITLTLNNKNAGIMRAIYTRRSFFCKITELPKKSITFFCSVLTIFRPITKYTTRGKRFFFIFWTVSLKLINWSFPSPLWPIIENDSSRKGMNVHADRVTQSPKTKLSWLTWDQINKVDNVCSRNEIVWRIKMWWAGFSFSRLLVLPGINSFCTCTKHTRSLQTDWLGMRAPLRATAAAAATLV